MVDYDRRLRAQPLLHCDWSDGPYRVLKIGYVKMSSNLIYKTLEIRANKTIILPLSVWL